MFGVRYHANPWVLQKNVLEYFLGNMLAYLMKIKFLSHTPSLPLLKNHRFVTPEPQNFHFGGRVRENV